MSDFNAHKDLTNTKPIIKKTTRTMVFNELDPEKTEGIVPHGEVDKLGDKNDPSTWGIMKHD